MSHKPKGNPRSGADHATSGLLWLLHTAFGRWMALVGLPLLAIGAGFLAAAWQMGPQAWFLARVLHTMTVSTEAKSLDPFFWLEADMTRVKEGGHWSNHAKLRLCLTAEYQTQTDVHRRVFCGLPTQVRAPDRYGVLDMQALMTGMHAVWPSDARGNPLLSLRMEPELHEWLATREAAHWMLSPQIDTVRDRFPPVGTELDYLLLEFDRPVEWLIRLWPVEPRTAFEVRYGPDRPDQAFPAVFIDSFGFDAGRAAFSTAIALVGLAFWGYGVVLLLYDQKRRVRLIVGLLPLLLLPWWSGLLGNALRWSDSQAYYLGLDFMREVMTGRELEIVALPPADFESFVTVDWPALEAPSHYAPLLDKLALKRPIPRPADSGAALREAARLALEQVKSLSDEEALRLFKALTLAEQIDRGEVGLIFIPAARETALGAGRADATRQAAIDFLTWLSINPIIPRRDQVAFEERIALWRSLFDFPASAGVAQSARTVVKRAQVD